MKKVVSLIILLVALTFLWGCAEVALVGIGAGAGIGVYKRVEGRLTRDYPLAFNKALEAATTALTNLSITVSSTVNKGTEADIEGVRKDGIQVYINLKDRGQGVSTISVRVGNFGNRSDAQRIHEEIYIVAGLK